jgi:hypothetical protein
MPAGASEYYVKVSNAISPLLGLKPRDIQRLPGLMSIFRVGECQSWPRRLFRMPLKSDLLNRYSINHIN